jgi:cyclic pyranopterin phosphate synthase
MPEEDYTWLPREGLLDFDELARVTRLLVELGVTRTRLTGGEPLLRRDLPTLVAELAHRTGLGEVTLTTNGVLLADLARPLADAGLTRITVSLDTLDPSRFRTLTRKDDLPRVLAGLGAAAAVGLAPKIDTVVLRGVNDDELVRLLDFARDLGAEPRFIEYMDVGGATRWRQDAVVSRAEILARLAPLRGPVISLSERGSAPAESFELPDGQRFGIIASVTAPFCSACDRARVTADGQWFPCLYARHGLDLKGPLRSGASDESLALLLRRAWESRDDRGAELRAALPDREPLVPAHALKREPHLEMHTRGG